MTTSSLLKKFQRFNVLAVASVLTASPALLARSDSPSGLNEIKLASGQILYEFIGEGFNLTPPASAQIGYFTHIKGIDTLFATTPEDVSSALFTFYRDTVTVSTTANGPMRIVSRQGTTTIYLHPTPGADLSNPDSFRAGVPIQVSTFRQQAIIDTINQTFTIVDEDTITAAFEFTVNGIRYRIGQSGNVYRTMRTGHLNAPGVALAGWLGGYSVGAEKIREGND